MTQDPLRARAEQIAMTVTLLVLNEHPSRDIVEAIHAALCEVAQERDERWLADLARANDTTWEANDTAARALADFHAMAAQLASLTAAHERVKGLVGDWRRTIRNRRDTHTPGFVRGLRACSDELDEALTTAEPAPMPQYPHDESAGPRQSD